VLGSASLHGWDGGKWCHACGEGVELRSVAVARWTGPGPGLASLDSGLWNRNWNWTGPNFICFLFLPFVFPYLSSLLFPRFPFLLLGSLSGEHCCCTFVLSSFLDR
jgi:hypothetical protein